LSKIRTSFVCQQCGYSTNRWMGKCPGCGEWNTLHEEIVQKSGKDKKAGIIKKPINISEIPLEGEIRISSGILELDRVLGGGIVPGSFALIAGDPGIGKSTLMLQVSSLLASGSGKILYISGEESLSQIKMRSKRLGLGSKELYIVSETNIKSIEAYIKSMNPLLVVIDSIQAIYHPDMASAPGSVGQVRECAAHLMRLAKTLGISIFTIGHITKDGSIAGPRILEHMVDCVLYFEGERHYPFRILRSVKNRFGSTNEIGIFEMDEKGLKEVLNPSEMLLSGRPEGTSGSIVISSMEGTRSILIEVQALLSNTTFGMPRRTATGLDYNRVVLLMAVLEKRIGLNLSNQDAYLNVAGGMKIDEPAADLGIAAAIASSFREKRIDPGTVAIGEIGLAGEIRGVNYIESRIKEAAKLGFTRCVVPKDNLKNCKKSDGIEIIGVSNLRQGLDVVFN